MCVCFKIIKKNNNKQNVTQLPDAQRRLELCEKSFRRSYGDDLQRLIALKGNGSAEKALIMRLHLLQGVLLFHQNRRNEAYEKFMTAETELESLKVDDTLVAALVEMGYEPFEARLALRSCSGNVEQSINFIHERKEKLKESRKNSRKERKLHEKLSTKNKDTDWVNPRSVCTLVEMGFERDVVVEALKCGKNDLAKAVSISGKPKMIVSLAGALLTRYFSWISYKVVLMNCEATYLAHLKWTMTFWRSSYN